MDTVPSSPSINNIRYQLIKSITSVAANYRAACRARSDNEFYAKLCITVEEADESLFWIEMLEALKFPNDNLLGLIKKETIEILSILAKSKRTSKKIKT